MKMQKKMWISLILAILLVLVSGLLSACSSNSDDPDLEDEDLPEFEQDGAAVSAEESYIVAKIALNFGPQTFYEVELLEFDLMDGKDTYYRYQVTYDDELIEPTVLIRHRDGALFTYYAADGTILPLEDDPVLGPYMSEDVRYDPNDTGHGLPGSVDLDYDELYNQVYDEYDDYYEGYDLADPNTQEPVAPVDPVTDLDAFADEANRLADEIDNLTDPQLSDPDAAE